MRIGPILCLALIGATMAEPLVVETRQITPLAYDAGEVRIIATSAQTEGRSGTVEALEMPGFRTPWHRHDGADEYFYVLEGVLTMRVGDRQYELPAGSFAFVPKGTPHGQANTGKVPVRVLITFAPGGFEQFFLDRVKLAETVKPGDPDFVPRMMALSGRYPQWITQMGRWDPAVKPVSSAPSAPSAPKIP